MSETPQLPSATSPPSPRSAPETDPAFDDSIIWKFFVTVLAIVALIIGVIAIVDDDTAPLATVGGSGVVAGDGSGTAAGAPGPGARVAVALRSPFQIELASESVPTGEIVLDVTNEDSSVHNVALSDSVRSADLGEGESDTLSLGVLDPGSYELSCLIPGHASAGMIVTLTVIEAEPGTEAATGTTTAGHDPSAEPDYAAMQQAMLDSFAPYPAETLGTGNEVMVPEVLADGTKVFDLTAEITEFETEPGRIVDAWTYNGQVPGPVIKVDIGDAVRVVLNNKLPMATDVHFHGIRTPFGADGVAPITQDPILPGETYTYEFTVEEAAVGMFHAHFGAQMSVPNGLLGTFLVGQMPLPEVLPGGAGRASEDEPPTSVDQEIPMVLNDAGVIGLTINGKGFPATTPIVADEGDWILLHYMNEGLLVHPMHLHQFPQLVIAKDGLALDQPYWSDTVLVGPGERYSVLIHADVAGTWVWHCHILTHAEREEGMFGMVTALVVQ